MMSELGRETVSAYAAAKGGLKMLTRNICSEFGGANIQCNGIGPGYIETLQTAPLRERQADGSRHPFDQFIISKTPAARWGKTEDLVGPYELHDFYLYYMLRFGFSPAKLYRLARLALGNIYDDETLRKWLKIFIRRFFNQQFKRSCLPDGPKVGSVGLSPRGDWRMPSDASSALWLAEVEKL